MTTIAYSHKCRQIAVDGRSSSGDLIASDKFKKWIVSGEEVWFLSGAIPDFDRFMQYHAGDLVGKPDFEVCCSALVAIGGECHEFGLTPSGEPWRSILPHDFAIGSGRDFAISAMDLGMQPDNAVAHAATRDSKTGGKITVFDLATMSFVGADNV